MAATYIISAVLLGIVTLVVVRMIRRRKENKGCCGCPAAGSGCSGHCH